MREGKSIDELFDKYLDEKTFNLEDEIILKTKHLRIYVVLFHQKLSNGLTVRQSILQN